MENATTLQTADITVKKHNDTSVPAFLTISQSKDNESDLYLTVWIRQASVLHSWHTKAVDLNDLWHVLANPPEKMEALWNWTVEDTLQVAIRDSRKGIPLTTWKATLPRQADSGAAVFGALQAVYSELAATQAQIVTDKQSTDQKIAQLQQAAESYQQTAQQLQGEWESEKKQLLTNFLKVYNARVQLLHKQSKQVEQLQQELATATTDAKPAAKRTKQPAPPPVDLPEDEMDMDDDMVTALEQGVPVQYPRATIQTTSTATTGPRIRQNHVTGVKEYLGADAVLDDVFGKEGARGAKKKRTLKDPPRQSLIRVKQDSPPPVKAEPSGNNNHQSSSKTNGSSSPKENTVPTSASSIKSEPKPSPIQSSLLTKKQRRARADSSSSSDSSGPLVRRRTPASSPVHKQPTPTKSARRYSSSSDSDVPFRRRPVVKAPPPADDDSVTDSE